MDKRLEKIRHFKGTVMDFEEYVNSRIRETKRESGVKESLDFTLADEPKYSLANLFGNPSDIICYVIYSLREVGKEDRVELFKEEAVKGDFNNLLTVAMKYLAMCNEDGNNVNLQQ